VVDYIRRPYSTLARFFKDDEGPPVIIQWYAAAPGAPTLGRGTSFMSLDWTSETTKVQNPNWPDLPWNQRPGEIFEAARPFAPWPTPIGLNYAHVCGTDDDFLDGAVFDSELDVQYDEQGLPLCCNGPAVPFLPLTLGFDVQLIEEAPTSGTNCADATDLEDGVWYVRTFPTSFGFYTYRWAPIPGSASVRWRIKLLSTFSTGQLGAQLFRGSACNNFVPPIVDSGPLDVDETRSMGLFVDATTFIVNQQPTPQTLMFRVDILP